MDKEQLKEFNLLVYEYRERDFYVQAKDAETAKDVLVRRMEQTRDLDSILPEIIPEEEAAIIAKQDGKTLLTTEPVHIEDWKAKGYDCATETYIVTVWTLRSALTTVWAQDMESAKQKAVDGTAKLTYNALHEKAKAVLSGEDRVILSDGKEVDIVDEGALAEKLKERYPGGLTVRLMDESVKNLIDYSSADMQEWVPMKGFIDGGKDLMTPVAYGLLKAEVRLKPEDYDMVYACEDTYYDGELSELGVDCGTNAASILLATEEELSEARCEMGLSRALLDRLYIEGRPYSEVMETIRLDRITDDEGLLHVFDSEYLQQQPEWKSLLAKTHTQDIRHKQWVEKGLPAFLASKETFEKAYEQAAKEAGFSSTEEMSRFIALDRNISPEMAEKLEGASRRVHELWEPARLAANRADIPGERVAVKAAADWCRKFDDYTRRVTDIRIMQYPDKSWRIRCKIDGEQMAGVNVDKGFNPQKATVEEMREQAYKAFRDDIASHIRETELKQAKGMHI